MKSTLPNPDRIAVIVEWLWRSLTYLRAQPWRKAGGRIRVEAGGLG